MKKSRKSKIVLFSVLGLATVSLATVGFASWVLNTVKGVDDATFKAEVGDVLTNEVSASITAKELAVSFDNVASPTNDLKNGNSKVEDLEFSFTTTISATSISVLSGVEITFAPQKTFLDLATSSNDEEKYIVFPFDTATKKVSIPITNGTTLGTVPTIPNYQSGDITVSNSSNTTTITTKFRFAWGAAFGGVNPGKCTTVDSSTLLTRLNTFRNALTAITATPLMTITVTPTITA